MKKGILNVAINEACKSTYKQRVGAVIFDKKRIISVGHNYSLRSCRSLHPRYQKWEGSVHAEVDCILNARRSLAGLSILVVRVNSVGEFMYSKPCDRCSLYLEKVGIRDIYYINKEGMIAKEI